MDNQTRSYDSSLYTFNTVDFLKGKIGENILYHFYNLCDIIFKEIRDALSEPVIDLFHDEKLCDGIAIAIKSCDDIYPSESANYCCIIKETFKKLFEDDFIQQILPVFLAIEWKSANLYGEFLSLLASGQQIEVTGMVMAVLSVTLRFSKNLATENVLHQILDGYFINHLLRRRVHNEKHDIFCELNNVSLRKFMDFCYANTAYSCAGTDDCYCCRITDYIKDEFRSRKISDLG